MIQLEFGNGFLLLDFGHWGIRKLGNSVNSSLSIT